MQAPFSFDSLLPAEMARKAEDVGINKSRLRSLSMFTLAVLAGAFIAMGAIISTTATTSASSLPYGIVRLLAGITFSVGLILVVIAGAELFTGNNLIVMAWASRKVTTLQLLRNWLIVYLGNFVGSILTALLMFVSRQYLFSNGALGLNALNIGHAKVSLGFWQALVLGIFCNALVCLAVWLCMSARSATDRVMLIIPPIATFVAAGFEHSVANMYFIPIALFIKAGAGANFWQAIGKTAVDFPNLTWGKFFLANLLPVTIGNIIGGAVMVGLVYWSVYLRFPAKTTVSTETPPAPDKPSQKQPERAMGKL